MRAIGLAVAIVLGSSAASAAPADIVVCGPAADDTTRVMRFTAGTFCLAGETCLKGPAGEVHLPPPDVKFASLIKLRAHFVPELNRSTDAL